MKNTAHPFQTPESAHRETSPQPPEPPPNARRTLAFFGPGMHVEIVQAIWPGLLDAARKYDVNLLYIAGKSLRHPSHSHYQANVLYDLFSPERVDGVISWSSTLGSFVPPEELTAFLARYTAVPMVSVGEIVEGMPSLVMDSYQGMYAAVEHLIDVHGSRRLAFLRGPEEHFYAQERYRAYLDVLQAHGVAVDERLITLPYGWFAQYGAEAVRLLLDERGLRPQTDIDALVSVNDKMAGSAIQALYARGLRVPQDIAVVGFNDDFASQFTTPPLTSVKAPLYELGTQAIEVLLALLEGESVPERVNVPAKLMVRQSCGCVSPVVAQAAAGVIAATDARGDLRVTVSRDPLLAEMTQALAGCDDASTWSAHVLNAFLDEIGGGTTGAFLASLTEGLRHTAAGGNDVEIWHAALSLLRRHILPCLETPDAVSRAEDLWHQARAEIGETETRVQGYQEVQQQQQARMLRDLGAALLTTFDVAGLMDTLCTGLPRIGIPACYLALYENPQAPAEGARLMLAYNNVDSAGPEGRIALETGGRCVPAIGFLPEDMVAVDRRWTLIVKALYFQKEHIGFVVFDAGLREGGVYEILRGEISSALQGALLVQRVREKAAEIARQQYILDAFMANIPDSIYFKDRKSRIIRSNKAHAASFGLTDPGDLVGKTDFDLFPHDQAHPKYAQEQEILRTGEPVLAQEEPNAGGGWVLTTKMPLRDEHGDIIGTFGISRDITALKQIQSELEQAYAEVEQHVKERTVELQQEITERMRAEEAIRKLNEELEHRVSERTQKLQEANQALQESLDTLKLTQKQLVQSEKMAALGGLVAGIAHEINTPLGVGVTAASYLDTHTTSIEQHVRQNTITRSDLDNYVHLARESSDIILRNLQRASELIESFKQVAVDQTHEKKRTFTLKPYLDHVLTSLRPKIKHTSHHLIVTCPPALEIYSYPGAFSQIISNFVLNSLIHGFENRHNGKIQIEFTVRDTQLWLRYQDNGKGMDQQTRDRIFDPFFTTKRGQGGTGLGLHIVYNLVTQKLGGQIMCESSPNNGVVFLVSMPIEQVEPVTAS